MKDTTALWTYNVTCHCVILVMERTLFVSAASVHALEDLVHPAFHWVQESVLIHWRTARKDCFQPNLRLMLALQQCALINLNSTDSIDNVSLRDSTTSIHVNVSHNPSHISSALSSTSDLFIDDLMNQAYGATLINFDGGDRDSP